MLTDEQLQELAVHILYTSRNVYTLCLSLFNIEVEDDIFDTLRVKENIFICEECSIWYNIATKEHSVNVCMNCGERING